MGRKKKNAADLNGSFLKDEVGLDCHVEYSVVARHMQFIAYGLLS
jgi:hypothetical protein